MNKFLPALLFLLLISCAEPNQKSEPSFPPALSTIFEAHGGFAEWQKMQTMEYDRANGEHHTIDLKSRKTRIDGETMIIGFDNEQVWVTPDTVKAEHAGYYYNLCFYFLAMPFVTGDPGINYEMLPQKELNGKLYDGIKISYQDSVGNSSKDNYIIWADAQTHKMEWLMYTFTYFSKEESEQYNLIHYDNWQTVNGLLMPQNLQWFEYKNDSLGGPRGEPMKSLNLKLSKDAIHASFFEKPTNAQIVALP